MADPNTQQGPLPATQYFPAPVGTGPPSPSQTAAASPVPAQPVATPQVPAYAPPAMAYQAPRATERPLTPQEEKSEAVPEVRLYSHSALVYWWPVWLVGYIMALVTYLQGQQFQIGGTLELYHPSSNLGVIFFLTLALVILITNVSVRGLASGMILLAAALVVVLLAYFRLWDEVLRWVGNLQIHLNFGAYFWFSTLLFAVWVATVLVFDHVSYWNIKPGQITREYVFGAGSDSYDTDGMMLEKHRNDVFRHWILGLGAGDMRIHTTGATHEVIDVPNVLFLGSKIAAIQRMIATKPDEFGRAAVK